MRIRRLSGAVIGDIEKRVRAAFASAQEPATALYLARRKHRDADLAEAPQVARDWADTTNFEANLGQFLLAPGQDGSVAAALAGLGDAEPVEQIGALPRQGGDRVYALAGAAADPAEAALAWALGFYRFERYRKAAYAPARLKPGVEGEALDRVAAVAAGVYLARDLVNTPAGDLGPADLEAAARSVAERHGARFSTIAGEALESGYPMIHAVGRAGPQAPRLIDLRWGDESAPKVTLVGKGVCFDTGGLDIKPPRAMRNMKKDMGGAAASLALAHMIMALGLPVRLRVLIPAVENSVASNSFRPGDILTSRKGLTVEIGDTDAEGRLVLADALADADAEEPDLLFDFATLTGAARVALGPDLPPFYTADETLAGQIEAAGRATQDPVWRLPLWDPYDADLSSSVADLCSTSSSGFAGSIAAALFLRRFVGQSRSWAHFDIFAWNPKARPGRPEGGECQAARAALGAIETRFGSGMGA